MNYNMQGMTKTIPKLFAMLKSAKVEIKKEHPVLMVNKTTSFNKKGKGKKGNFKNNGKQVAAHGKKPKLDPSLRLSASTVVEMVTRSGTAPNTWRIRRMAKWTKVYLIYKLLMCTLLVFIATPRYLIPVRLIIFVTWNRDYGLNEDWLAWKPQTQRW